MELQSLKQRYGIIGNSPELNYALDIAMRVSPTNLTVLITGESGVGKEIFSKIIHALSPRKHNPFIAVNCGAIPEGTIDSELFGHEKGSFTGATDSRKGYFEQVNGGTIFLDEIGEMPLGTQARLLRMLESGEFIRVGSSKVQKADVRVIAATNVKLVDGIKRGKFREDLYYRLSTVPIIVPPLRERKDDIFLLFRKFAVDIAEKNKSTPIHLTDDARELLQKYEWPGNIRELKNIAEQISVLSTDRNVDAEALKRYLPIGGGSRLPALPDSGPSGGAEGDYSERDLLYKLFFDMKSDLNDLKHYIFDLSKQQNADLDRLAAKGSFDLDADLAAYPPEGGNEAILINTDEVQPFSNSEEVEESLSIADKERELIERALKKHRGKRKDAANDLGISERTLYRKIKEYDINE